LKRSNREKESADAYLKFLQSKGASAGMLYKRSRFLDTFMSELKDLAQTREQYADAIQKVRKKLTKQEQADMLAITREFFPFWIGDIKAVAQFEKRYGFHAHSDQWHPKKRSLKDLRNAVDSDVFTNHENNIINKYLEKLYKNYNKLAVIQERAQLAKILLVRLRDTPDKNHVFYRKAVDLTLPLFDKKSQTLYLNVAREFHDPWKSTPEVTE